MSEHLHLVCPSCAAVNRVKPDGLVLGPTCGKCKTMLYPPRPQDVSTQASETFLSRTETPLLIDFWAPWCGPCRMMAPAFEQAAKELHPDVLTAKVNTQDDRAAAEKYQIRSIPTMVLFKNGRELARTSGAKDAVGIKAWVKQHI